MILSVDLFYNVLVPGKRVGIPTRPMYNAHNMYQILCPERQRSAEWDLALGGVKPPDDRPEPRAPGERSNPRPRPRGRKDRGDTDWIIDR